MKVLLPLLILLLLPACSFFDSHPGSVTAEAQSGDVIISNDTSQRVYYFVVGRRVAALINWAQHLDPQQSVAPGRERSVDVDTIMKSEEGEVEAIVYWWHAAPGDTAEVPGPVNAIIVDL